MMSPLSRWLLIAMAAATPCQASGDESRLTRFEFSETHMGSSFKIVLYTADEPSARRASAAAFARIAALDSALSDYQPDSELMRLCEKAGGPPVSISADLFEVLRRSKTMYERSAGAFDATVAPVVRLWRRASRDHKLPAPDRLAHALSLVGSDKLRLDPVARTAQLLKPGMKLDVGGIAKGYASAEAIAALKRQGITRALVAGAGDIVVSGPPPGSPGWTIGIASLNPREAAPRRYLSLRDAAVSTAGDAERYVEIGGKRYSHIVDPRTGLGVVDRCSVTVISLDGDGAKSDSLDTAAYVLGPERGLPLIEATPHAAALIVRYVDGHVQSFESRLLRQIPSASPKSADSAVLSLP